MGYIPLLCLLVSQISYPVALPILGEVRAGADLGLSQLRASFGSCLTLGEFLVMLREKTVPLQHDVWQPGSPGNFPRSLSFPVLQESTVPSRRSPTSFAA